jgi:hypothetical protein
MNVILCRILIMRMSPNLLLFSRIHGVSDIRSMLAPRLVRDTCAATSSSTEASSDSATEFSEIERRESLVSRIYGVSGVRSIFGLSDGVFRNRETRVLWCFGHSREGGSVESMVHHHSRHWVRWE